MINVNDGVRIPEIYCAISIMLNENANIEALIERLNYCS